MLRTAAARIFSSSYMKSEMVIYCGHDHTKAPTRHPKGGQDPSGWKLYGPFVESEQIWALSRNILLYGPERPFTAQVFFKKETLVVAPQLTVEPQVRPLYPLNLANFAGR